MSKIKVHRVAYLQSTRVSQVVKFRYGWNFESLIIGQPEKQYYWRSIFFACSFDNLSRF